MKRNEDPLEAAKLLSAHGFDYEAIVEQLIQSLALDGTRARSVAARVCEPKPRRRRGQVHVRHPSVG